MEAPPKNRNRSVAEQKAEAMTAWTAADSAELEVLIDELLAIYARHLAEDCTGCRSARRPEPAREPKRSELTRGSVCPAIVAGIRVVVDWRDARMRRSRAEWLRLELDAVAWLLEGQRKKTPEEAARVI